MRIRTIKPEFWTNEKLCSLPECTHLFAAALLNYADDDGYFNANPGLIKGALFPIRETSRSIPVMIRELSEIGYLKIGETDDERKYGLIVHFSEHQVINKKKESKIKCLEISWFCTVPVPDEYRTDTVGVPPGMDQGKGREKERGTEKEIAAARPQPPKSGVEVWNAYSSAYLKRYGTEPARNAKVNALCKRLCDLLPADEAPLVAAHYLTTRANPYAQSGHCLDLLIRDAQKIHTEWKTGQRITQSQARENDRVQGMGDLWQKVIDERGEK